MTILIPLIILASVVLVVPWLVQRSRDRFHEKHGIKEADYVVMRTHPSLHSDLAADFRDAGWHFSSHVEREGKHYYRFEKTSFASTSLSDILGANGVMPRTANRKTGAEHIIAFVDFGKRDAGGG